MAFDYFPYKDYKMIAICAFLPLTILFILLPVLEWLQTEQSAWKITFFAIPPFLMMTFFWFTSKVHIRIGDDGIWIIGYKKKWISWGALHFIYRAKDFKGHDFWILSPRELCKKRRSRLANIGRIYFQRSGEVVIFQRTTIDKAEQMSIERFLHQKIST